MEKELSSPVTDETENTHPSIDEGPTPEQQVVRDRAQKLITKDAPTQSCCVTMLAARQLYYVALEALRRRMVELGDTADLANPGEVEEHLVGSMATAANQTFPKDECLNKLQKHVLPWFMAVLASDNERDMRQAAQTSAAVQVQRRKLAVDLGITWTVDPATKEPAPTTTNRERPVVFAGNVMAVKQLLDKSVKFMQEKQNSVAIGVMQRPTILRLTVPGSGASSQVAVVKNKEATYREVYHTLWCGKLTNYKKTVEVLSPILRLMKGKSIDMLVIDDLSLAAKPMVSGQASARVAGSSVRHLRRWAEEIGCGIMAAVPAGWGKEAPDFVADSDWSSLRDYTELRGVSVGEQFYDEDYLFEASPLLIDGVVVIDSIELALVEGLREQS